MGETTTTHTNIYKFLPYFPLFPHHVSSYLLISLSLPFSSFLSLSLPFSPQRYGDSFPRKPPAKIVAAAWMFISSFVLCNVIASQCLNGYDVESASNRAYSTLADVNGQRIAVPASTLMEFLLLRRTSGATSAYKNCEAAFDAIVEGEETLSTSPSLGGNGGNEETPYYVLLVHGCIVACMVDLLLGLLLPMGIAVYVGCQVYDHTPSQL